MLYKGTVVNTGGIGLRLRESYPSGTILEVMPEGAQIEGDAIADMWMHVTKFDGKEVDGWAASWYMDYELVEEPFDMPPYVILETPPPNVTRTRYDKTNSVS